MMSTAIQPDWQICEVADPGLQAWIRYKVRDQLFIHAGRMEPDDLVQEVNRDLLEHLDTFAWDWRDWVHFCRWRTGRTIRRWLRAYRTETPAPIQPEDSTIGASQSDGPGLAISRPNPTTCLSRCLAELPIETVSKLSAIPLTTLKRHLPGLSQAMARRYPHLYPNHQLNLKKKTRYPETASWEPRTISLQDPTLTTARASGPVAQPASEPVRICPELALREEETIDQTNQTCPALAQKPKLGVLLVQLLFQATKRVTRWFHGRGTEQPQVLPTCSELIGQGFSQKNGAQEADLGRTQSRNLLRKISWWKERDRPAPPVRCPQRGRT